MTSKETKMELTWIFKQQSNKPDCDIEIWHYDIYLIEIGCHNLSFCIGLVYRITFCIVQWTRRVLYRI